MKYEDYINLKFKPSNKDLICEFYVEAENIKRAVGAVASESSIGTWTEVKTEKDYMKKMAATVFEIKKHGNNSAIIEIAYPQELFEFSNIPNILSSVAGNVFGMKEVENLKLLDINFPKKLIDSFKGPKFGIPGIRKITKIRKRPLIGTIIKPKLGLNTKDHARVAYESWIGGCDITKDDENLSNQKFNKFEARLKETLKARDKAEKETGERKMYIINVTAETEEMLRRAKLAKNYGNEYVMVDVMTVGWSALQTLRNHNEELKLVLHAHRAGHAALSRNPKHGISMVAIAKFVRLIGVDQLHIGTILGKMEGPKKEVLALDQEMEKQIIRKKGTILSEKWEHIKPVFAVCSGGLNPLHIPFLIKNLGNDIIMQFGGGIHGNPLGTKAGAIACRQALDAVMQKISLKEASKKHAELKAAFEKWAKD